MDVVTTDTRHPGFEAWMARWCAPWCAVHAAGCAHGRTDPALESPREVEAGLRTRDGRTATHLLLAVEDERALGAARVDLQLGDNTHVAEVEVAVPPEHRRRGVGSALLRHACDIARTQGRTRLRADVERPAGAGPWPGSAAADSWGLPVALVEARRRLDLPLPPGRLQELEAAARPHAAGYRVRTWRGRCPEADVDALAGLLARMSTDAPTGRLQVEPEAWDAARVRAVEERLVAQRRTAWTALAEDAAGDAVGFTQLLHGADEPERLHQWDTLVVAGHRGHRLGLLLKTAALRAATADVPGARRVTTRNAVANRPMIAINEALGFRLDEVVECREADVEAIAAALARR